MAVWEGLGVGIILLLGKVFSLSRDFARARATESRTASRLPSLKFQRNLDELNRYLLCSAAVFFFVPIAFLCATPDLSHGATLVFFIGLVLLSAYPGFCVIRLRRRSARGALAELRVAETLDKLDSHCSHAFHDFPTHPEWRIGHVLVNPSGIYAIETLTEPTLRGDTGKPGSEVLFDGTHLHFPDYIDTDALGTARRSASDLTWFLTQAMGWEVEVTAVLVIPGCRITRNAPAEVLIVNPDELQSLNSPNGRTPLTLAQINLVANAMKTHLARDVSEALLPVDAQNPRD